MSDEEVERFEITDYDLDNEFNFKRSSGMSKNERIYGIWADPGSSGDEGSSSRRPSFKGSKKSKNYTAPIGFIAGGVQQAGKNKEKEPNKNKEESDNEAEDENKDGLGMKSSRGRIKNSSSEESEEENSSMSFQENFDKQYGQSE